MMGLMATKMKISGFADDEIHPNTGEMQKQSFFQTSDRLNNSQEEKKSKKFLIIGIVLSLLLLISVSLYIFVISKSNILSPISVGKSLTGNNSGNNSTSTEGKFENPLNGMLFSDSDAVKFKDLKPIAVMVNNYDIARPSAGLSQADVVYEVVAEAGITRIMPIFFSRIPPSVSSIRSARYYFVELASAYHPHYIHWGAAFVPPCQKLSSGDKGYCPPVGGKVETDPRVDAYDRIVQLGLANLDGGNYSCDDSGCAFGRDPNKLGKVPLEHTAFVRLPLVYDLAKKIRPQEAWHKFTPIQDSLTFKDEEPASSRGEIGLTTPITYKYWDTQPAFDVKWVYDKDKNEYVRYQGGVKQIDANNQQELRAKVVIVRLTRETPVGDKKGHLFHDVVGTGKVLVFQDGKVISGTWQRRTEEALDVYKDEKGEIIKLDRGQIWVQLVPSENKINYSAASTSTVSPSPTKKP
ncbi:MAG: DUF3048 domain-containing protein [Niabella sp.]|nr:MAG: DUF3048 domain-containing protein [Niabella sp.]